MTLDEMLQSCGFDMTVDVCDICAKQHPGWEEEIEAALSKEFPDEWPFKSRDRGFIQKPLPANHPLWERRSALYRQRERPCITWSYDDSGGSICHEHWQQVAAMLRAL